MAVREDAKREPSKGATPKERDTGLFAKASAAGSPPSDDDADEELELLSLLSRADLQECLAMLTNVVSPLHPQNDSEETRQAHTPLAQLNHTVLLELRFPETSIYRHPPGSSFEHQHSSADSRRADEPPGPERAGSTLSSAAGSGSSGSTAGTAKSGRGTAGSGTPPLHPVLPRNPPLDRPLPVYSPQNPYASDGPFLPIKVAPFDAPPMQGASAGTPASNQNPAVPPPHRGVQQVAGTLLPFLQVVATLQPENDLVLCTTILANMPLPVTLTGSPEKDNKDEAERDKRRARARADERRGRERESADATEKAAEVGRQQRLNEHKVREQRPASMRSSPVKPSVDLPPVERPARIPLPPTPSFGSSSPFPDGYKPSRPPLAQRSTSYSSISGASSGGSTVIGRPPGSSTTPENRSPHEQQVQQFADTAERMGISARQSELPSSGSAGPSSRRGSYDRGLSPSSRDEAGPPSVPVSAGPPTTHRPQQYSEPIYGLGSVPLQTPSVSEELKELWADDPHRTNQVNELPRGFVKEKESRAAVRRRGAAEVGERRETDNEVRERERRRQTKKRDKEWKREQDERNRGHEGLGDLAEQEEPPEEGEGDEAAEEDEADDADDGDAGDKYEGVLGFDEEDTGEDTADDTDADGADDLDNEEMDRLRVKTRTGSTSSDGSAHEREQAAAEAHRAQAQQEAEEERRKRQERTRPEPERRRSSEERLALIDAVEPPRPERRRQRDVVRDEELLQEELGRPEDEAHLVLQSSANLSDTVSSTGSEASHASSSAHRPGLSDGPGSSVHDEGSDVQGNAELRRYGDPFFDLVAQTPCGRMMLAVDWSATSLGDIRSWGGELRSHVMAMLASPFSTAIWYGADNVLLYNDAYARLLGPSKHPAVLGKSGAEGWSELWDVLGPLAGQVFSGKTLSFSDHCNCIMRNGALEETCAFPTLTLLRPRSPLLSTGVTG